MKILLLSGSHSRHLYFFSKLLELDADFSVIAMERETQLPETPNSVPMRDQQLFTRHFAERFETESQYFGNPTLRGTFADIPHHFCDRTELNSLSSVEFVDQMQPDVAIVFGADMVRSPLFESLPDLTINLHLGLSPWYRGAATLFWPFFFLEPQYAGSTFHQITGSPDAGGILHQSIPSLEPGDGIHDVAAKTVQNSVDDFCKILRKLLGGGELDLMPQKNSGKLFLNSDFKPAHLRLIYEGFNNDIVDEYLAGNLGSRMPQLTRVV